MKSAASKQLLYGAGGLGLAALENQYVANELPDPLKNVNLGLGAITGILAADPATRTAALAGLPIKEMGLFGIGALDKLRHQQQSLVDANLGVADINRQTADINRSNAGSQKAMTLGFLIPALAGGGAAALWAYDKWRKQQQGIPRYKTLGEKGRDSSARSKIRIDIPTSAVPDEFYRTLSTPEERDRSHIRLLELMDPNSRRRSMEDVMAGIPDGERGKAASFIKKAMSDENEHISIPRLAWSLGTELTGVPAAYRAVKDFGQGFSNLEEDNAGSALRYGLAGLGGTAAALATARWGLAPGLAKLLGRNRLLQHTGQAAALGTKGLGWLDRMAGHIPTPGSPGFTSIPGDSRWYHAFTRFPGFANWASKHTRWPGMNLTEAEAAANEKFMHNPNAFAWTGRNAARDVAKPSPIAQTDIERQRSLGIPTSTSIPNVNLEYGGGGRSPVINKLYNTFLTRSRNAPTTLPGHLFEMGRFGANRALQGAYNVRQLAGRYPNASMYLGGAPLALAGTQRDDELDTEARRQLKGYMPDWAKNRGNFGMPLTGTMGNIFKMIGLPDVGSGVRNQLIAPRQYMDPFGPFR